MPLTTPLNAATVHIATIGAYPVKGGGYRGVLLVRASKERMASDLFGTLEEARYWAKAKAHAMYEGAGYRLAPLRRAGEYRANVWVRR